MPALDINDERNVRIQKLKELREEGIDPFPSVASPKQTLAEAYLMKEGDKVQVVGRIMTKRDMGKIMFCHIQDESSKMQIAFKQDDIGKEIYKLFSKKIDIGDIVQIKGARFQTMKGEESISVAEWTLLTKAIRPLPDKFHGIQDEELRYRRRYLDLLMNPDLREMFKRKNKFWAGTRAFLEGKGFLEVETPVLETTAGGADAEPFATHHNALDMPVYLRISMGELWQKRLMVAGFEKTFEIGRQFRNEGMSREHLQDYTQMEFYWGYADYEKGMVLVEEMYKFIIEETFGTLIFDIGKFKGIDLGKKWERVDYSETIKKNLGIDIFDASEDDIKKKLKELGASYKDGDAKGRLVDSLWKQCRKDIKGPAFLMNHPVFVSPLAKRHTDNPELTQRFQVIIAGSENGNGYSELNDPIDQAERFEVQAKMREAGDIEAQMHDQDFVEALEYGMPPTCGFGFSERLFSFLEDKPVRECVLFPLMKPEGTEKNDLE
ncbi:MAG: lysine--tRNA ligase [Candidatus Magasanikbacteria bacterium]